LSGGGGVGDECGVTTKSWVKKSNNSSSSARECT